MIASANGNGVSSALRHRSVQGKELVALTEGAPSVFQQPAWWRAVEEGLDYSCVGLLTEGDAPLALILYFQTRRGPFRLIGSPLPGSFTPYQHPIWLGLGSQEIRWRILREQHAHLLGEGFSSIEWWFPQPAAEVEELARQIRAKVIETHTLVLAVDASAEAMWKRMESRGRNMVRKAEKAGVRVHRRIGTDEEVSAFYQMLAGTFSKSGRRPPHPFQFYRALVRNLVPADRLLFLTADVNDRILAMGLFLHDAQEMHYLSGTSLPDVGAYAPNNLLQWEAIRFAVERGLRRYDLGGTGIASIDQFKKSMGGQPQAYSKLIWRSGAMGVAASVYFRVRPIAERARYLITRSRPSR